MGNHIYKICINCGVYNTPWRQYCKQCRQAVDTRPTSVPLLALGDTATLFWSADRCHCLLVSRQYVEYQAPGLALHSAWFNIAALKRSRSGPYLRLREPVVIQYDGLQRQLSTRERREIPLAPFEYYPDSALAAVLKQHGAHLYARK